MWIWLLVAVAAAIGELLTTDLFLAAVALAAVVAAITALLLPVALQVLIFAVLSLVGIFVFRPFIKHSLGIDSAVTVFGQTTEAHLAGRQATVTQLVDSAGGQIRIGQGEFWSARSYNPEDVIQPGQRVEIVLVDGLTALVESVQPLPALESSPDVTSQKGI